MNIAFILPSLANKGPIIVVKDITDYLSRKEISCKVYYFDDMVELSFSCPVEKINMQKPIDFAAYDVVHSHMFRPDLYVALWKRKRHRRTKFISTIHMSVYEDILFAYGRLKAFLAPKVWLSIWRKMDSIVVLTKTAKNSYTALKANKKIFVINNGRDIDINVPIPEADLRLIENIRNKNLKILGTVASFNKRKGLEQAFSLLSFNTNLAFVIVGDGDERANLESEAARLGLEERCFFLGTRSNGFAFIRYFDTYFLPSRSEGLPLALIEAVASKVPVVCSAIEVFKEIFSDQDVAFFELDNPHSLQEAYQKVLAQGQSISVNAYAAYLQKYTVPIMAGNYLELYKKV